MSTTRISDIIEPKIFAGYLAEASVKANKLIATGIVGQSPVLAALLAGGSTAFNFPFWKNLDNADADANVPTDDPSVLAVPRKMTASQQVAVRMMRNQVVESAVLAGVLAGSDPMAAAAAQLAAVQNSDRQKALIATLKGAINEANTPNLVHTIASETVAGTSAATSLSASAVIDATANAWGDANGIAAMVVHSKTYAKMQKDNLITFQPTAAQNIGFGTYLGMYTLIVDDRMPVRAGTTDGLVYTSYIIKQGGIMFGLGSDPTPIEFDRNVLAGNGGGVETLVARDVFSYHVAGTAYAGSLGVIPTNTVLATAASWSKVFDDKNVGVCAIVHNLV